MELISISKNNEVYLKISCTEGVKRELYEHFSFFAPNYRFHPKYKKKLWDGKIRLFNRRTGQIYAGLLKNIAQFCRDRNYQLETDFSVSDVPFSEHELDEFIHELCLTKTPRNYQREAIIKAIRKKRISFLSPTASGKSFIIYLILRILNVKSLLIVPTTSLVLQMRSDFIEYSENDEKWLAEDEISIVMGGYSKENLNNITISTWQSIYDMPPAWFDEQNFECVILDEMHGCKATSIVKIMESIKDAEYRIGLTGTFDDSQIMEMSAIGLFGPVFEVVETKELIENKTLSDLMIKCLIFNYGDESKKAVAATSYPEEIDFLVGHKKRNEFIKNLALSLEGNTLLLFGRVESHGKILYKELLSNTKNKKIFYVSGEIKSDIREEIRKTVEEEKQDCIIVASLGVFSTGVNIVNLHSIIMTHPTKSKIKVLQSIGRGLRRGDDKTKVTFFDVSDDLKWKSRVNYTYKHFLERLKVYVKSGFAHKIYKIKLED